MFSGLWNSWICGLVSTLVWDIHTNQLLQIFILFLSLLLVEFPLSICYMLCDSPIVCGYFGFIFSSFTFSSFWRFYWYSFNLTDFFFSCAQPIKKSIKDICSCYSVLISYISFWFFFRLPICLLTLPMCSWMLFTFPIKANNILIIYLLKFLVW